jgi:GntR family transcriptional regulator
MRDKGIELSLDESTGVPLYRQIIRQIENAILSGKLKPGDRLPTIRSLAVELKINPNTIARAYSEMELLGIVATQVGSGTYVPDLKAPKENGRLSEKIEEAVAGFLREMSALGLDREEVIELIRNFEEEG